MDVYIAGPLANSLQLVDPRLLGLMLKEVAGLLGGSLGLSNNGRDHGNYYT